MDWLKSLIDWAGKHLPVPMIAFTILVACSVPLFFAERLSIQADATRYRFIETLLFVGSAAILFGVALRHIWRAIALSIHRATVVRNLSQPEKEICEKLLSGGGYSMMDNVGNPVLVHLQKLGILRDDIPPWQHGTDGPRPVSGFVMQNWARKRLGKKLRSRTGKPGAQSEGEEHR